ncbi:exonuclease SbcCD subunit D [Haloimpatiens sp. FM7330]|uniref:exonuclease SbcCD subunit D n=1 Tax=Haloimpatiens sp. FM7330 TaxID=3298610 RepID=UPI00364569B7
MRIIHTSDWHLGKMLEGNSRLSEQEKFIDEFIDIVNKENVDMVIIAGDIYDNSNPPARAEKLFYRALKEICCNGKRAVLVIAGNHDNPERLIAASPLAYEQGIIMLGTPRSTAVKGKCGQFEIVESDEGYFEINMNGEKAVIITLPYPSEKRLNEIISDKLNEEERQKDYSDRIGDVFSELSQKYRDDTINLAVSHLFVLGGESSDSERPIQLGGSLTVAASKIPQKAQYVALGHLHKPQKVKGTKGRVRYCGAPIQYSKSERHNTNCAYIVDLKVGQEADIKEVYFKNYKPIEVWKCESIEEAIDKCKENSEREIWVYLEIKTDRVLLQEEIKEMKKYKKDIIEIKPIIKGQDEEETDFENLTEKSMDEVFKEFYKHEKGIMPSEEVLDLFLSIVDENNEDGEEYETQEIND